MCIFGLVNTEHVNMRSKDLLTRQIIDNCIDCEIFSLSPSLPLNMYNVHSGRCLDFTWSWNYEWAPSLSGWSKKYCLDCGIPQTVEFPMLWQKLSPLNFRSNLVSRLLHQIHSIIYLIQLIHSCEKMWKLKSLGRACRTNRTRHIHIRIDFYYFQFINFAPHERGRIGFNS